jgi:hypothetical protein
MREEQATCRKINGRQVLCFEYEMSPHIHMFNIWSLAGGTILAVSGKLQEV